MITYWKRNDGVPAERAQSLQADTWAYVTEPTDGELDALASAHHLERDLLQDAIDPNEVPRVQQEGDIAYFFLRAPSGRGDQAITIPLMVALAPTFLITVSPKPFSWLERFRDGVSVYNTAWRSQLVWRIILELNARYQSAITDVARNVRGYVSGNQPISNQDILRLVAYEGILNDLLAALQPMSAMLANVMAGRHIKTYEQDKDLMEDIVLGNGQALESARAQLRTTANMREAFSVIATNNLNRVIKFLTLVTVVLTVPMVVSGLYGMNVRLPGGDHPLAFGFVVLVTLAINLGLLGILRARKLL
ncbi:MAG: magnesium transporter CorA family protein [Patescibacteria group bacterium]